MRRRLRPPRLLLACVLAFLVYVIFLRGGSSRDDDREGSLWDVVVKKPAGSANPDRSTQQSAKFRPEDLVYRQGAYPYNWTLVLATTTWTDTSWVQKSLAEDLLAPRGSLDVVTYVSNDPSAPLHPPKNKGNEAMVYLSYMIDAYDDLPDISVFMHGQAEAWHNNDLLNFSSSNILHWLNLDKVHREGYVNLRCQWTPGCPAHIHPHSPDSMSEGKDEEPLFLESWQELFPSVTSAEDVPEVIAQPCCSQFALSREAIRRIPRQTYLDMQQWIIETPIGSALTGSVFEYVWQFLFLNKDVHCPDPRVCLCDTYGVCFKNPRKGYDDFFRLRRDANCCERELEAWVAGPVRSKSERARKPSDPESSDHGDWLRTKCQGLKEQHERLMIDAWEYGKDPARRKSSMQRALADLKWAPDDNTDCRMSFDS